MEIINVFESKENIKFCYLKNKKTKLHKLSLLFIDATKNNKDVIIYHFYKVNKNYDEII